MKFTLAVLVLVLVSGCSTMAPPRYGSSPENVVALREYKGAGIQVTSLRQSASFSAGCRLMGDIEPADGKSIPEFIGDAINSELQLAEAYGSDISLTGEVNEISFSSIEGLTNGEWIVGLKLEDSDGATAEVRTVYRFKSGFDAITACNATADALTPAVQDTIRDMIGSPDFAKLVEK